MRIDDPNAATKTRAEIDEVKAQWLADPCWDIGDTPGFEAHRRELSAFQVATALKTAQAHEDRMMRENAKLGFALEGDRFRSLVERLVALEDRVKALEKEKS